MLFESIKSVFFVLGLISSVWFIISVLLKVKEYIRIYYSNIKYAKGEVCRALFVLYERRDYGKIPLSYYDFLYSLEKYYPYKICTKYKGIILENYHHLIGYNNYRNKESLAEAIHFLKEYDSYAKLSAAQKNYKYKGTFKFSGKGHLNGMTSKKWDFFKICIRDFIQRIKR